MKIIVPESLLKEIINADLSFIEGDMPTSNKEVRLSRIRNTPQPTTDDFVTQASQFTQTYPNGWFVREQEEEEQEQEVKTNEKISEINILDILNEKGLKQAYLTFKTNLTNVEEDNFNEVVAIILKDIMQEVDWNKMPENYTKELMDLLR
jgi:hypothetical protein